MSQPPRITKRVVSAGHALRLPFPPRPFVPRPTATTPWAANRAPLFGGPIEANNPPKTMNTPQWLDAQGGTTRGQVRMEHPMPLIREEVDPFLNWNGTLIHYPRAIAPRGQFRSMDTHWLRDLCPCEQCVDPNSGQRRPRPLDRVHMLAQLRGHSVRRLVDDGLEVRWNGDDPSHQPGQAIIYPGEYMRKICASSYADPHTDTHTDLREKGYAWNVTHLANRMHLMRLDYNAWVSGDDKALKFGIQSLAATGLLFLTNVPAEADAVSKIAERVGPKVQTIHGDTWSDEHNPNAENVAYTSQEQELHQDMLYMDSPPRLQVLHAIKNSTAGGETLFSDTLFGVGTVGVYDRTVINALATYPVTYKYECNGHSFLKTRNVLEIDPLWGRIARVWWSPQFLGPFPGWAAQYGLLFASWLKCATEYQHTMSRPDRVLQYRLAEGEAVLYDNWRVLHGRRAFDPNSGERLFRGACVGATHLEALYDTHAGVGFRAWEWGNIQGRHSVRQAPTAAADASSATSPQQVAGAQSAEAQTVEVPPAKDQPHIQLVWAKATKAQAAYLNKGENDAGAENGTEGKKEQKESEEKPVQDPHTSSTSWTKYFGL